jgi:hypothetical protein
LHASPGMELTCVVNAPTSCGVDRHRRRLFAGLPFVRIIHGKGTGSLRQAVQASPGWPSPGKILRIGWR